MISRTKARARLFGSFAIAASSFALVMHARVFDFVCDDAFITLRFARNFARMASPVYNVGEHVEGYTSFTWMALCAALMRWGLDAERTVHLLGAMSGVAIIASTWLLWNRVEPTRRGAGLLVLLGVAVSAPVAAWTMGGLETPLFVATATLSIALGARAAVHGTAKSGFVLGLVLAATTLTRPEGAALTAIVALVCLAFGRTRRRGFVTVVGLVLGFAFVMGPFEAWRIHYYGYPLPNTFYVKTSGGGELIKNGVRYVQLCLREMGEPLTQVLLASLFFPARVLVMDPDNRSRVRSAALWMIRIFVLLLIPYVASVGGDFLDLYRFLAPMFPLVAVAVGHAALRIISMWRPGLPRVAAAVSVIGVTLAPHAWRQIAIGQRARHLKEPRREQVSVEPVGWTRLAALQWSATGRWIAAHAEPGDWMVTGAAGAMPYYAGADVNNLDVLGLCDAWVSHHGRIIGTRPGHQREATEEYMLSKRPVFVLFGDHIEMQNKPPKRDDGWERKGYVWVVATIDEKRYGAPKTFYHYLLVRIDRAQKMIDADDVQTALGLPE